MWRAPTQLDLPVIKIVSDGTYLTALIQPTIRGRRRTLLVDAARAAAIQDVDLSDPDAVFADIPQAFDDLGRPVIHLARVVEYDVPDRDGNGTGELDRAAVHDHRPQPRPGR